LRKQHLVGGAAFATALAATAVAVAQITHGVPSANLRAGSPATKLAAGWDQKVLATGALALENPSGIFTNYGYLNDAGSSVPGGVAPQASNLKTKTEPDQNTYVVTSSNPGGPTAGFDYGRHFLFQGHEVFIGSSDTVGHTNAAYLTRINLDLPLYDPHRITLLSTPSDAQHSGLASVDGSTYDPFTGQMLFTGEAGDSLSGDTLSPTAGQTAFGGVYATNLSWSGTTAPAVLHSTLQKVFGHAGYEGVQVDDNGSLILLEDSGGQTLIGGVKKANSYVFRFLPKNKADLTAGGTLQALQVSYNGTPMTYANQDPFAGAAEKALYGGGSLSAKWIDVHKTGDPAVAGSPDAGSTTTFDANYEARQKGATPLKRPENGRFVPASGFRSFVFTVTGDTAQSAGNFVDASGNKAADRGAWGAVLRIDMPASDASTATVRTVVPGDGEHASYDSISFLDKNTVLVGEDRGDALHAQLNALDSTWSFDLTKPFDKTLATAQRLIAQGRDPDSTADVDKKEASPAIPDQNDGDNEVTGVLVSNGISTTKEVFGTYDPAQEDGVRAFYTGQHGANATYELLAPGPLSGTTLLGCQIELGKVDCWPKSGNKWGSGQYRTHGHVGQATEARLTRSGLTFAKGKVGSMHATRAIWKGLRYTLVVGSGATAQKVTVRVG
jgi:hypothetical protein